MKGHKFYEFNRLIFLKQNNYYENHKKICDYNIMDRTLHTKVRTVLEQN